ncbi:hypothetical protein BBO99_00000660 [Phytophthora kernoviae]|uniref:RxLR effector protein n=2 Tax=Phytophthora kernoviae TaxID=325452 RepID=A0A3R7KA67_9STRA|nr:hypothetical protein G195_007566 [Phytophthora kernoviae 00238/432]KAG2509557.1 hypothetical protein JM16_008689 [Phytophthora kernoviae]KAG2510877.1 hypothetical protein JM18_008781 [Phytophthora kernoviae]RLN43775.1 hypothetical protein BBI17_001477 [Phytophthora kernoviae]RLN85357.1 hypothetical protein BBO99_00000660 [Phytophthora kernoviae]
MKIKMKSWLHKDKLPTDIFNKLGLRGLGQGKVKDGKNYKYYKRYMELWKKKDAAYQTKMDKKLDLWLTMKLLPTDVYRQLGLRGVKSNEPLISSSGKAL